MTLLDAIQAEREELLAPIAHRLAVLDEIERLATALNGGSGPSVPAEKRPAAAPEKRPAAPAEKRPAVAPAKRGAPAKPPRTSAGIDGLSERELALLQGMRSQGASWLAQRDLWALLPAVSATTLKRTVKVLVGRGLIEAQGATSTRRYRAVSANDAGGGGQLAAVGPTAPPPSPPAPTGVKRDANTTIVLRSRVLHHLSRRRLSEQNLATVLNADREYIADVVGKLLLADKIVLDPDGCYRMPS